ncbi:MAG: MBL fold metallo-hydrolase [Candidatus Woesearchaeota archaeon]
MEFQNIEIHWLGHASFLIKYYGIRIFIDPFKLKNNVKKEADYVFITHSHYDHLSIDDLSQIKIKNIIAPADAISKLRRLDTNLIIVQPEKEYELKEFKFRTVPAYNTEKPFHPKINEWLGYLLIFDNVTVYHAGDTDAIHEMSSISGKVDIALLPIGGTYTMNAEEAVYAIKLIKPKIVIPMHYGTIVGSRKDVEKLKSLLAEEKVEVVELEEE